MPAMRMHARQLEVPRLERHEMDRHIQDTGALAPRQGVAPAMTCLTIAAYTLWCLGFPAQAVRRCQDTLALAQEIKHPHRLSYAHLWEGCSYDQRGEVLAVQE
jgi:hypothetical protein